MAKTISELRNQSIQVRDASAAGENTAIRVGTVLNDIVGHIEDYENTQSSNNSSQDAKIDSVKTSLNAEIARAKTEESNLSNLIGTERTERQAAVSKEETARIQADNAEKTARQQADNAEQDARIKADNAEKTARENADITLRTMIQTEVSDREKAVAAEAARAKAAEQANAKAIADETARAKAAEETENTRATTEEERLQGEIDNTNTNLTTLDDKVNSNHDHLTDEVARLDLSDNEIKADLEAETARAKAAEEANATAIAEEKAAIMGTERIADGAVKTEKLADNVVTISKIAQDAIDKEPTLHSYNMVSSNGVAAALAKISEISEEVIDDDVETIEIKDNDNNNIIRISPEAVDAKNLKSNGKNIATEEDISVLATKKEVEQKINNVTIEEISEEVIDDDNIAIIIATDDNKPVSEIQAEITNGDEESQSWNSDDYDNNGNGEQYAKINKNGVYGKGFFNIDGTPIKEIKHVDLYVATDGNDISGDGSKSNPFATIFHTNETITDASADKEYFIHVADGVYTDLQTKFAGNQDKTENFQGVLTRDHVHYIGNTEHPENVIIKWDGKTGYTDEEFGYYKNPNGETVNYAFQKCPFHIIGSKGSGEIKGGVTSIKGFTFDCKNTRYCLHVEMNGYGEGVEWLVENCRFIWHGTPDCQDKSSATPTIGTGSGNFEKGTIRNCVIINDEGATEGFRNHDNYYRYSTERFRSGANINIENCKFDGGGFTTNIMFRTIYGDNKIDGYNLCNLKNCVGIKNFTYQVSSGTTILDWRASIKACEIENNVFEKDNYLQ